MPSLFAFTKKLHFKSCVMIYMLAITFIFIKCDIAFIISYNAFFAERFPMNV